jgi:hypothetical protein
VTRPRSTDHGVHPGSATHPRRATWAPGPKLVADGRAQAGVPDPRR